MQDVEERMGDGRDERREAGAQDSSVAISGWAETGDVFVVAFPLERTSWWDPDPGWDRRYQPPPSTMGERATSSPFSWS